MEYSEESISLREVVLIFRDYIRYLWRNKLWIVLATILSVGLFILRGAGTPDRYSGQMTVVVNQASGSNSLNGLGSLLGAIGIGGGGENEVLKVKVLSRTYDVVVRTLLDSAGVMGRHDLIANHILDHEGFREEVFPNMSDDMAGFRFGQDSLAGMSERDLSILKLVFNRIYEADQDPILRVEEELETATLRFQATTRNSDLTLAILRTYYNNLRETYVAQSVIPQERTLSELRIKADSLVQALSVAEYQLANNQDRSLGITSATQIVRQGQLQRKVSLLNGAYLEVVRNLEQAEFLLKTAKPDLSLMESPVEPLDHLPYQWRVTAVFGALFGLFLSIMMLILVRAYRKIMEVNPVANA